MSGNRIPLNTDWNFAWTGYTSKDRLPLSPEESGKLSWYPAAVPGNAQDDLLKLGLIEDPYYADNADHCRWCEEVDFWYRLNLTGKEIPNITPSERLLLDFGGLDTFATIWIDGREIGRHSSMFIPHTIDVTGYLNSGNSSELLIRFGASAFESDYSDRDPCSHPPLQRTRTRRAQITYGWDIGPRLVAVGPWRPVELSVVNGGRILHAGVRTLALSPEGAEVEVCVTVEWFDRPSAAAVTGDCAGETFRRDVRLTKGVNDIIIPLILTGHELWWPNGTGEQILHDLSVNLSDSDGGSFHSCRERFGICRVDLLQEPRPDGASGFRFTVNNKDYFAKGMNWTPNDALFARITPERTAALVKMAAEANINMLRVWGGGIYEDKSFWDACDSEGILVWQDFMYACSLYPQDQPFLNEARREAESVVRSVRGHVSLAAWAGDNEIDVLCGPEAGTLLSRKILAEAASRLDGNRPYIVSSPFSEPGKEPNDPVSGDCHLWNHVVRHDDDFYTGFHANFVSEIGRISFPSLETIDTFIPKKKQWPPTNPLWYYHSSDTNRARLYRSIDQILEGVRAGGYTPGNLPDLVEASQRVQADAYQFWIEHFGGDPLCWGLLLWNLADIWPQVSDAIISYDLRPKAAYHAVKEAYSALDRQ